MSNRKKDEKKGISIYWWNFGRKTLDYKGPLKDYLRDKGITSRRVKNRFRFKIPLCSTRAVLESGRTDYAGAASDAIQVFLLLLGAKTRYTDPYGRKHRINWS